MSTSLNKISLNKSIIGISLLVGAIVYFKFLSFGHISWDDPEMIFKNKFVKTFDLKELLSRHFVGNYIPVTMIMHSFGWLLFGNNDGGHHFLNILLHLVNGILVYRTGKRLLKDDNVAIIGMVIFLLHPGQMESVGWISELKNIMSTTFYLGGLLYYLTYTEKGKKKYYVICFLFFVLGCFSKSSVVVFPLSLVCVDIALQKKISYKFLIDKIPLFIIAIVFGLINIKAQTEGQFINYAHAFPYAQRIGFAGFALFKYLLMFLAPFDLSVIYPYPQNNKSAFFIGYFVIASLVFLLLMTVKRKKYNYTALILFTVANFILVLQFIPFGEVLYADRYMYIPIIGLAWIFASLLGRLNLSLRITAIPLLIVLGLFSFSRAKVWRSGVTLYEDILRNFPNSFVALNSIGVEYMMSNDNEKASFYLNKSILVAPYNYKGFYNRGLFYLKNNKANEAIKSFNQSLEIYKYSKSFVGRASAFHMLGEIPKAIADANAALDVEKNNAKAHFVLGNCYNDLNKLDMALNEYNTCIGLNGEESDFYFKRAIVYGKRLDFKLCIADINTCLTLDPAHFEAYYWRGVAKVNLGQNACEDFKIAARNNYQASVAAFNKYCR